MYILCFESRSYVFGLLSNSFDGKMALFRKEAFFFASTLSSFSNINSWYEEECTFADFRTYSNLFQRTFILADFSKKSEKELNCVMIQTGLPYHVGTLNFHFFLRHLLRHHG